MLCSIGRLEKTDPLNSMELANEGSNLAKANPPNALKHGAFSRIAILPGEDADEYPRAKFNTQADWAAEVHKQLKLTIRGDLTPPEQEMVESPPLDSLPHALATLSSRDLGG
jgi:hypothetical protein